MAQTQRISGVATNVRTDNGQTVVRYHSTDVVKFDADTIVLDSGGWQTMTTKTRMNQASNQYGLNYSVYQKEYKWYVDFKGQTFDFEDNMILSR